MATGVDVYPYDATPDVAPITPQLPNVTEADVGKTPVISEALDITYVELTPISSDRLLPTPSIANAGKSAVIDDEGVYVLQAPLLPVVAQADLDTTTATKGIVSETNAPFNKPVIGTGEPVLGLEYVLFSYGTPAALTATGTVCRAKLPDDILVRLSAYEIHVRVATTNDASNSWDVKLFVDDSEVDLLATESEDPDEWVEKRVTNIGVLAAEAREVKVTAIKKESPGNLEVLVLVKLQDVMATQA